jgi:8-oxo-dGTP diphosphatase
MTERVRAIIIESGQIVLIKRTKGSEVYYVFPGGGVEEGESKTEAMVREGKEELGVELEVGELLMKKNRDDQSQVEYFYLCKKIAGTLGGGIGPEYQKEGGYEGTHEVIVVPVSRIENMDLLPIEVRDVVFKKFSR